MDLSTIIILGIVIALIMSDYLEVEYRFSKQKEFINIKGTLVMIWDKIKSLINKQ